VHGRRLSTRRFRFNAKFRNRLDPNPTVADDVSMAAEQNQPDESAQASASAATAPSDVPPSCSTSDGEYWRWCPRCGHELHNEKCKLRCPRCHYFMSCSDFD